MKNKKELKIYDPEEVKKRILSSVILQGNKDTLLREFDKKLLPNYFKESKKNQKKALAKINSKTMEILRIFENDSHIGLMETFGERYRMVAVEMCKDIISEFNCSNESEKSLAGLIVNAYLRVIDNSRRLNLELEGRNITPDRNIYIANLSKQLDRAHRQFTSSLMTLKQLKSPMVEMNIKATTAFISQNQQINAGKKINENE